MKRPDFELLNDEEVIWACVEPIMLRTGGKDPEKTAAELERMNDGQRALFLFQILYGHATQGILPLYAQVDHLMEKADVWSGIKAGMQYFGDLEMLNLVEAMEAGWYLIRNKPEELLFVEELEREYNETIPISVKLIASYVRSNASDFIEFEEWAEQV